MNHTSSRSGFTMIEMMVAVAVSMVVLSAVASTFIFCQRMFRLTMGEAELALAGRELRDKLLFHAGPALNEGLLTGVASADSAAITVDWTVDDENDRSPEKIRILQKSDRFGKYLFNERCPHNNANERWLRTDSFRLRKEWSATIDLPRIKLDLVNPQQENSHSTVWILLPLPYEEDTQP